MAGELPNQDGHAEESARVDAVKMIRACRNGDEETVRELLERNPLLIAAANDGFEPLHYSVLARHGRIVKRLLQHDADPHSVTQNIWGHRLSTVDIAKARGFVNVVKLVEEAVRKKHRLALAEDPLRRALKENDLDGIKRELQENPALVNTIDEHGNTAH